jgi:hypothetical protein
MNNGTWGWGLMTKMCQFPVCVSAMTYAYYECDDNRGTVPWIHAISRHLCCHLHISSGVSAFIT